MPNPEVRDLADVLAFHPLLPLAWRAAGTAGRFLRDERPELLEVDTKSSPSDSVTVMDRTAEDLILHELLGTRPTDGLLGEEGGERLGTSGVRWIVDPLDGTVNYLFRLPMWGVSIAAEEQGTVTVGVVATPEFDEAYIGVLGQGAWHVRGSRAERMSGSTCTDVSSALVTTGFGYDAGRRRAQAAVVAGLIPDIRDVRRLGAAVVDFCWLARGRVDAYYEDGLNAWDYAAGALIAQESGAIVTGLRDNDFSSFVLAAAPGIADELRAALVALAADDLGVSRGA
jgi:myo-inositol-1(or 4)-monophosphatase